ncbi:MAG: hypothetical protein WA814_09475 [Candidatus Baltobacteraceae bacterium]
MRARLTALCALTAFLAWAPPTVAASTPPPSSSQPPPHVPYPKVPLHTEAVVEVNSKGQVVRIKSTKQSKVRMYNLQTFGNALQMWIRRPDGTAEVGLYRVTYDYDPKTEKITRNVSLVSSGGSWANDEGAANVMMQQVKKQALEMQQELQKQNAKLPSLNQIRGAPTPKPTPKPTPAATLPPL